MVNTNIVKVEFTNRIHCKSNISFNMIINQMGWVMSSTSVWSSWAPSFTTYNWEDYQAGFHPSAIYKMGDLQFCAKFNRGVCPATPYCTR